MSALLGHDKNLRLLKRYVDENRPAHAYLFSGTSGVGKKKAALDFACMINCRDFFHHDHNAGCNTCRRILSSSHPDVHVETPQRNSIRIDAVRNIISFLKYPPVEATYRLVIVDDAHLMNRAAQNALLKTLEEPPPNRIIILVTSRASSMLPTVRSRLRKITFGPLNDDHLKILLSECQGISTEDARAAIAMASGSIERAILKASPKNVEFRARTIDRLFKKGSRVYLGMFDLSSEAGSDKIRTMDVLEIIGSVLRDILVTRLETGGTLINSDYSELIRECAAKNITRDLIAAYGEVLKAAERLDLDINLGKTLLLDVTFLKIESILERA